MNIGPIQPFASVVQWHSQTQLARCQTSDWTGAMPLRIWFYTDGASCFAPDEGARTASASVVMIIETSWGYQFGGFRACLVPQPATAPLAEHVALHLATLWCLQMLEWCTWTYGKSNIPVVFAFDCLAAGAAAQGRWLCQYHANLHRRTRALQQWIDCRFHCPTEFLHVPSHRGDPWNEAADAICWAAVHGWIPAFDFECLCTTQLTPYDDVVEWLWFWQNACSGVVGYPCIRDGAFCFQIEHSDLPAVNASEHTLARFQADQHEGPRPTCEATLRVATANVLTLYPNKSAQGGFVSARHEALMHSFHEKGIQIAGVQETRSRLQGHHETEFYHVLSAPALQKGHFGVQIWVAKEIAHQSGILHARVAHLRILHQSARKLIVRLSVDGLKMILVSGHVPCMPDEAAAQQWWHHALTEIPAAYRSWPRILLIDANARVGSLTSSAIGSHQASDENAHGEMIHQWLVDNQMFAPQTMEEHHIGDASTFAHATGTEGRIDFVLIDECLRHPALRTFVMDIDLTLHRPDHYVVAADVPISFWQSARAPRPRLTQPHGHELTVTAPPAVPWSVDVHSHAVHIHRWLQQCQPRRKNIPRKRHLQDATWELIQSKAYHWKRVRQIRHTLRIMTLRCIFDSWRTAPASSSLPDSGSWMKHGHFDLAWHLRCHQRLCATVAQRVRQDDNEYYQNFAQCHSDESLPNLWKTLKPLLPKAAAKRTNNLRCVGPATTDIVQHFDGLEVGEVTPYSHLLLDCHRAQQEALADAPLVIPIADLPSRIDIERICCKAKRGKAPGLDHVTAETLRTCALPASDALHQLILKAYVQGAEPLQWKGGKMHVIPKKASILRADAMRGIMLLTTCGKIYHALLRQMLIGWTTNMKVPAQMGGFHGQQASFATHLLRTFCGLATRAQMSFGVLFFDVKAAFHNMIREHAFGGSTLPPRLCEVLSQADFDVAQLCRDIAPHCARFADMPNFALQRAVRDAHDFTMLLMASMTAIERTGVPGLAVHWQILPTTLPC